MSTRCAASASAIGLGAVGIEPPRSAEVLVAGDEVAQTRVGALGEADARALADGGDRRAVAADPQRSAAKQIDAVVPTIDLQRRRSSGPARARDRAAPPLLRALPHVLDSRQRLRARATGRLRPYPNASLDTLSIYEVP